MVTSATSVMRSLARSSKESWQPAPGGSERHRKLRWRWRGTPTKRRRQSDREPVNPRQGRHLAARRRGVESKRSNGFDPHRWPAAAADLPLDGVVEVKQRNKSESMNLDQRTWAPPPKAAATTGRRRPAWRSSPETRL
jgi:hypothetical protein